MKLLTNALAIGTTLLKLVDIISTYYLINYIGIDGEANPVVKWTITKLDVFWAMVLNFSVFIFLLAWALTRRHFVNYILLTIFILMLMVSINNSIQLFYIIRQGQ